MLVFTLHLKVDAKLRTVNEITRNLFLKQAKSDSKQMPEGKNHGIDECFRRFPIGFVDSIQVCPTQ